jgi:urea carboxylase
VFDASYLVLALGDVYLGAPVATPIDPRHRLVTTKYNPARTWTAENSVGIGGAYLCVYGMEGPGGYQLVGRTIQMWNRWRPAAGSPDPWLLRTFDQIRFHPVSHDELARLRAEVAIGRYRLDTEDTSFALADHRRFLAEHEQSITAFTAQREAAFAEERARWEAAGVDVVSVAPAAPRDLGDEAPVPDGHHAVLSPMAGALVSTVEVGTEVESGDAVAVIEAMKTETAVVAGHAGRVAEVRARPGEILSAGTIVAVLG